MADFHMSMVDPIIDVTGLAKAYAGRKVVENVSLLVALGEIVGLVGANGGGKTTTLRIIAGLLQPDQGTGTVFGDDIRKPGRDCRARIGYMSQRLALHPDLTVRENLRFRASVYGIPNAAARLEALATDYGITDVMLQRFATLSGGWARRVQFAATILHAPPLLLLDEPTAGLDAATRQDIWGWLAKLSRGGHAIILATHDLAEAERLPKIMLYHQGRASEAMTPAALIAQSGVTTLEEAIILFAKGEAA
jgi:ABC-2 type transport system ATP-binding protein